MIAEPVRRARVAGLRAELTKLHTLVAVRWLLAGVVVALVVGGAAVAVSVDTEPCRTGACGIDPVRASLGGVWLAQIAVCALGVIAMTGEYDTPQIGTTLAAMPRRFPVLPAKTTVVAAAVAAAAAIGTFGALVAGRATLARNDLQEVSGLPLPSLADATTVRAGAGTVLYLVLVAVLAVGSASVLRDRAAALAAVLGLLFSFPLLAMVVSDPAWRERLHRYAPMEAGLAIQSTRRLDDLPIGPWPGLAVLAADSAAALAAGVALFLTRDA
jgi:ABC-2 type transport system permease protein